MNQLNHLVLGRKKTIYGKTIVKRLLLITLILSATVRISGVHPMDLKSTDVIEPDAIDEVINDVDSL